MYTTVYILPRTRAGQQDDATIKITSRKPTHTPNTTETQHSVARSQYYHCPTKLFFPRYVKWTGNVVYPAVAHCIYAKHGYKHSIVHLTHWKHTRSLDPILLAPSMYQFTGSAGNWCFSIRAYWGCLSCHKAAHSLCVNKGPPPPPPHHHHTPPTY